MNRTRSLVFSSLVATAGLAGCNRHPSTTEHPAVPVKVHTVESGSGGASTRYSAAVLPAVQVDVAYKVTGYVDALAQVRMPDGTTRAIQEGDRVTPGTMLARIRSEDYTQRLAEAVANQADARASEVVAEADHKRTAFLAEQDAVSGSELDNQRARKDSAIARRVGADAKVAEARTALRDTVLTSPIEGVVVKKRIEVGSYVSGGTVAFTVADMRTVKVVFAVPDVMVNALHVGSPISIRADAIGGTFRGSITRVDPSADAKSRTFEVEATIPNGDGKLKAGMVASVGVGGEAPAANVRVALPLSSLVRPGADSRGFAVYQVQEADGRTRVALRQVQLAELVGDRVMVRDGLSSGDRVVTLGAALLHDGDAVRVIP
jgi:RND family efflux transporter MFP subunit